MYPRFVEAHTRTALTDTPVVLITGPRRVGKTTLARSLGGGGMTYLTLDDQTVLDAAKSDPVGFVRGLDRAIIDEVQRVPELMLAIKKSVDDDYRPGRFLLTGSANVLMLPRVADSLAGRMEAVRMLPLSQAEIRGRPSHFLDRLFAGRPTSPTGPVLGSRLTDLVLAGGFPEALARPSERRRQDWARAYLDAVLMRDLRDIAEVERLTDLPKFVRLLAEHAGQLVNYSEFGKAIGVNYKTGQRYVGLLEQIFLIASLRPWATNAIKRIVKTPKLHFLDSGLLATLRGLTADRLATDRSAFGSLLETFVFAEVTKLTDGSDERYDLFHFRDHAQREVDLVLERDDGRLIGLEVKASATVAASDFAGLRTLAESCGDRFAFGAVLHDGDTVVPFGPKLAAVPISCLWE
ncbi:ATP-binding protein [Pinisolibacter aquiterrae]|uniref:ATP-binding protein n=1 Tax=Pinisolibacter aquiterrae TaxID=2815579 RepID=UPI001C3D10FD|nr:ATP-binding protein [Pinisolibacter aquiterrae]MBV5265908.1 ATP-binding protein [Pinisolibacter aquiterrae]MCC8237234.1 ATP-binding protein [Pinisolibacter aquiterrae]